MTCRLHIPELSETQGGVCPAWVATIRRSPLTWASSFSVGESESATEQPMGTVRRLDGRAGAGRELSAWLFSSRTRCVGEFPSRHGWSCTRRGRH
ncbi:hypothetical protein ADK43_07765 [Streptomyces rimosus subsp. rimosus]|nr:hypothetical protein ADK43_07765 [Streptomyces rimosus subsp. rimosus]